MSKPSSAMQLCKQSNPVPPMKFFVSLTVTSYTKSGFVICVIFFM